MPQYKRSTTPKWRFAGVMTERREGEEPKAHVFRSEKSRQAVWIDAEEGCTGDFVVVKLPHPMDQCSAYEYLAEKATLDRVSRRAVRQQIEATRPTDGNPKTVAELQALLAKIDEVRPRPSAGR